MRYNYTRNQQFTTFVVLAALLIQSCTNNSPILLQTDLGMPKHKQEINTILEFGVEHNVGSNIVERELDKLEEQIFYTPSPKFLMVDPDIESSQDGRLSFVCANKPSAKAKISRQILSVVKNLKYQKNSKLITKQITKRRPILLSNYEKSLLERSFISKEGFKTRFFKQAGIWYAEIMEHIGSLSRTLYLPVYSQKIDWIKKVLLGYPIYVMLPEKSENKKGYVYVGNSGLKGGGNENTNIIAEFEENENTNTQTLYALFKAIEEEDVNKVRELLKEKIDINITFKIKDEEEGIQDKTEEDKDLEITENCEEEFNFTFLNWAIGRGNTDIIRLLLAQGAATHKKEDADYSPLYLAAIMGKSEAFQILLEAGADINEKTKKGKTFLHTAIEAEESEEEGMVQVFIQAGCDIEAKTTKGKTALHLAAEEGKENIVRILLNAGADINAKTKNGQTPLQLAVTHGKKNIAKILLEAGATIEVKTNLGQYRIAGKTPLHLDLLIKI